MTDNRTRVELSARAAAGDGVAFERLLAEAVQPAHRLAVAMLHDSQSAEDAVQEAAVKAWLRIRNLRPGSELRPWFLGIVANECRTLLRRRWWQVLKVAEPPRRPANADEAVLAGEDLRRELRRLPVEQAIAIVLYFYLDLPLEEVAAVTGASPAAAKSRIYRGLRRLRPGLEEEIR